MFSIDTSVMRANGKYIDNELLDREKAIQNTRNYIEVPIVKKTY